MSFVTWLRSQLLFRRVSRATGSPRCDRVYCNVPIIWWDDIPCTDLRDHAHFFATGYTATPSVLNIKPMLGRPNQEHVLVTQRTKHRSVT